MKKRRFRKYSWNEREKARSKKKEGEEARGKKSANCQTLSFY